MLTPEQIADGWKPHDGGPYPVKGPCELMFRDGWTTSTMLPHLEDWSHEPLDSDTDIIAYKEQSNG